LGSHVGRHRTELCLILGQELTATSDLKLVEYRSVPGSGTSCSGRGVAPESDQGPIVHPSTWVLDRVLVEHQLLLILIYRNLRGEISGLACR
jgi:hypothetical protein